MSTVILYIYNIYVSRKLCVYNGGHQKMEFLPKYSKKSLYISVSQLLSAFSPRAGPRFLWAVKLIKKEINSFIPASVRLWRSFPKPQRNTWNIALITNITDLSCGIGSTSEDTKAYEELGKPFRIHLTFGGSDGRHTRSYRSLVIISYRWI